MLANLSIYWLVDILLIHCGVFGLCVIFTVCLQFTDKEVVGVVVVEEELVVKKISFPLSTKRQSTIQDNTESRAPHNKSTALRHPAFSRQRIQVYKVQVRYLRYSFRIR